MTNLPKIDDPLRGNLVRAALKSKARFKSVPGDCSDILSDFEDNSVHMVLTSPSCLVDHSDVRHTNARGLSDTRAPVVDQLYRIIKSSGFVPVFSSPRLVHRVTLSLEDTGFKLRHQYAWRFTRRTEINKVVNDQLAEQLRCSKPAGQREIAKSIGGRRTPQLRPRFESTVYAHKPREDTFANNWFKNEGGLMDASLTVRGTASSTVMAVAKETEANFDHSLLSMPLRICEHLIRLFSKDGQAVLDPLVGSGTSCVAANKSRRPSIGIDSNLDHIGITKQRIEDMQYVPRSASSLRKF